MVNAQQGLLSSSAILVVGTMTVGCLLPWFSKIWAPKTNSIFLLGVGAMVGICVFDLFPEIYEMGGTPSLLIMALVWLIYSGIHLFEFGGAHGHHHDSHAGHGFLLFMSSMVVHCFSSGVLLAVSENLSATLAKSVLYALIIHKALEAFSVSAFISQRKASRLSKALAYAIYLSAVPAGIVATSVFSKLITTKVALVLSDVAAGTLAGCLLFDFLIPNLKAPAKRMQKTWWIFAGLITTVIGLNFWK